MIKKTENFVNDFPSKLQEIVSKARILTAEEVILAHLDDFLLKGYTSKDIQELKSAAAKLLSKKITSSRELLNMPHCLQWSRIKFGCTALDTCTRGGIVTSGITEICGAASVGKTQLLLQLCLMVQLPPDLGGLSSGVAYICTEGVFPSKRLFEMSKHFTSKYTTTDINYMSNIHIDRAHQNEQLIKCITERLPQLMSNERIGLIVIDSVAAIFRLYKDFIQRARDMRKLANGLLSLVNKYNCAVICVNQVANIPDEFNTEVPCLGLSWAHLGRTRILVSKIPRHVDYENELLTVRKLAIIYSPDTPNDAAQFLITPEGIVDVPLQK